MTCPHGYYSLDGREGAASPLLCAEDRSSCDAIGVDSILAVTGCVTLRRTLDVSDPQVPVISKLLA